MFYFVFFYLLLSPFVVAQEGLAAQPFRLSNSPYVRNVKLSWDITTYNSTSYSVERKSSNASTYSTIATVAGNSYDDYELELGTYSYRVTSPEHTSNDIQVTTFNPRLFDYETYDNTIANSYHRKSDISSDGMYYQYTYISHADGGFYIQEQTSTNGFDFTGDRKVMTSETICASISGGCHLERVIFQQHPDSGEVVMWAHLENLVDYGLAQVACASGAPGADWSFHGTYRPLGYDSRDMTVFVDDDAEHTAYLISAVGVNTDMTIMQLTSNWTAVDKLVNTVYVSEYREAPAMVKVDGVYYLFSSRASGWYPSGPLYIAAADISSSWSEDRAPANPATYASQSGSVTTFGTSYSMLSDRWGANWDPQDGDNRQYMLPISFSPDGEGFAYYKFYPQTGYSVSEPSSNNAGVFGIQRGKILSVGKDITVGPVGGPDTTLANDGVDNNPDAYFVPSGYPFTLTVDLGELHTVTQVDLTTRMVQGSETYYQFTILGSTDGTTYDAITDALGNTQVGFVPVLINDASSYRYVRLDVADIINTHNGDSATFFGGVIEYTVYGY